MYRLLFFALAAPLGGCGLIDSNIADFDLSLPEKEVTVDTADWMLTDEATVPAVDCSGSPDICGAAVEEICASEACAGSCGADDSCRAEIQIELFHRFELQREKPELSEIDDQPLVRVNIRRVGYTVSENTMNVDSPPLTVFVGPQQAMSSGHAEAEVIGTIPVLAAGTTVTDGEMELVDGAEEILGRYMRAYQTPFNIIVGSTLDLEAGDVVPQGRLIAIVQVEATAGL